MICMIGRRETIIIIAIFSIKDVFSMARVQSLYRTSFARKSYHMRPVVEN